MRNYQYLTSDLKLREFIPIPKKLLKRGIGATPLLIYGMLLDRATLSQKNDWTDDKGRVFIIYTIQNLAEDCGVSESTVKKSLQTLEKEDLIQRKRQGNTNPNHIYVKIPTYLWSDHLRFQKQDAEEEEKLLHDRRKKDWQTAQKLTTNNNIYQQYLSNRDSGYEFEEGESL